MTECWARQLKDFGQGVGFGTAAKVANADDNSKSIIENALKKTCTKNSKQNWWCNRVQHARETWYWFNYRNRVEKIIC
jgi:hypothetical protein